MRVAAHSPPCQWSFSEVVLGPLLLGTPGGGPESMEDAFLIDPVVGMRAEEVALTLDEGRGKARRANLVEVGQGGGEHGDRNAREAA